MPQINIKTLKLDQEKKDLIAETVYETGKRIYGIPNIEIYFNEYDNCYIRGKLVANQTESILVELQGPVLDKAKRAEFCKEINEKIHTIMKGATDFKLCYFWDNGAENEFAGMNGRLFSEIFKNTH
ncbi:tautomerase family protein [Pectinatus frisingensis]|uniref:tautomerase family protein n=1 Tax=Pectinatus frisingensis TaxID=865 RepID=UPI0018C7FD13|nr:hypothetical protein [Pectinatus frisingensis]